MRQIINLPAKRVHSRRATAYIDALSKDKAWTVTVEEKKPRRSDEQNRYLFGIVYRTILDSGLREQGWTNEDVHEYFLGEHFGWETLEGLGRKRVKPIRRSSRLNKQEFSDYINFIAKRCAEMGIVIPEPDYGLEETGAW